MNHGIRVNARITYPTDIAPRIDPIERNGLGRAHLTSCTVWTTFRHDVIRTLAVRVLYILIVSRRCGISASRVTDVNCQAFLSGRNVDAACAHLVSHISLHLCDAKYLPALSI